MLGYENPPSQNPLLIPAIIILGGIVLIAVFLDSSPPPVQRSVQPTLQPTLRSERQTAVGPESLHEVTKTEFFRFLDAKSKVENDLGVYEPEKTARITGLSLEVSDSIMVNWSDLRDRWWDEWLASRHPGEAKLHKKVLQQYFNSNIKKH